MAITVTPSGRTTKAWGRFSKYPLVVDLAILAITLFLFPFAATNAAQAISNYVNKTNGPSYHPSECQFAAIMISLNLIAPVVNVLVSAIHLYLFTSSTQVLYPGFVLVTSSTLFSAWIVVIKFWIELQAAGQQQWKWNDSWAPHSRHVWVSDSVHVVMIVCGFLLAILYAAYMLLGVLALFMLRTKRSNTNNITTTHSPRLAESPSPPYFEALPHHSDDEEAGSITSAADAEEIQTEESRPLLD